MQYQNVAVATCVVYVCCVWGGHLCGWSQDGAIFQWGPCGCDNCELGTSRELPQYRTSLTHWGRVTHICVGKLIILGSDNGLSPDRRQAIIWTNAGLLSIGPLRTYFSEILIKIQQFSLKKLQVKMSSAKWRPSFLGHDVLTCYVLDWLEENWYDFSFLHMILEHWFNRVGQIHP